MQSQIQEFHPVRTPRSNEQRSMNFRDLELQRGTFTEPNYHYFCNSYEVDGSDHCGGGDDDKEEDDKADK